MESIKGQELLTLGIEVVEEFDYTNLLKGKFRTNSVHSATNTRSKWERIGSKENPTFRINDRMIRWDSGNTRTWPLNDSTDPLSFRTIGHND